MVRDNVKTSLLMADSSKFLSQRQTTLGKDASMEMGKKYGSKVRNANTRPDRRTDRQTDRRRIVA